MVNGKNKTLWAMSSLPDQSTQKDRGQEIIGGYVLVAWIVKGDMNFQINHSEFPGHWNNVYPCPACPCNKVQGSPMAWNNFSPAAEWTTKGFDSLDAFATHCEMLGKLLHQLFVPLLSKEVWDCTHYRYTLIPCMWWTWVLQCTCVALSCICCVMTACCPTQLLSIWIICRNR